MAFSEALAARVRAALEGTPQLSERKMFGGIGFMVSGNMACGVVGDELLVRVGGETAALAEPHVRASTMNGRPMSGFVVVEPAGTAGDAALRRWALAGAAFAASLPPKPGAGNPGG